MIVTLTPNPSIDFTLELDHSMQPGTVHRAKAVGQVAGGKGVNVALAIHRAGRPATALFPSRAEDPFVSLLKHTGLPTSFVPVDAAVRTNTAITEPDGTTTKINGIGPTLDEAHLGAVEDLLRNLSVDADWVVLAGSLPPGAPSDWYSRLISTIRDIQPHARIAIDTSDAPLLAVGEHLEQAAPTLLKPNGFELGQLAGLDGQELEEQAANGEVTAVVDAARQLIDRGVEKLLVTLGPAGALLVTKQDVWMATPPPIQVVSTVGAGDSTLAGYLLGIADGDNDAEALRRGVAYGAAATMLPGTTIPTPDQLNLDATNVVQLHTV